MAFLVPTVEYLSELEAIEYTGDADARPGFYGRLSAPGYLDATDWSGPWFDRDIALVELCDIWEVDTDGEPFGSEEYDDTELEVLRALVWAREGKR